MKNENLDLRLASGGLFAGESPFDMLSPTS